MSLKSLEKILIQLLNYKFETTVLEFKKSKIIICASYILFINEFNYHIYLNKYNGELSFCSQHLEVKTFNEFEKELENFDIDIVELEILLTELLIQKI